MVGHALTAAPLARAWVVGTIATLLIDLNMTFHLGPYLEDTKKIGAIGFGASASLRSATRPAAQCSEGRIGGAPFKFYRPEGAWLASQVPIFPLFLINRKIGAIGFEPTASRSRTERTTRLCYAPNVFYEGFRSRQVSLTCHCDVLAHRCECAPTKDISSNNLMRYHTNSLGIGAIRPGTCRLRRNRAVLRPDAVHVTL